MLKIFAVVDQQSDWYPKYSFNTFMKYSNVIELTENPHKADLIWIYSYYESLSVTTSIYESKKIKNKLRQMVGKKIIIISTIHHLTPWKEDLFIDKINEINELSDFIHFFSNNNLEINSKYFSKKMFVLPYWIDCKLFSPLTKIKKNNIREKYSIPVNKIVIGNFQRDTESDYCSPKLEKGPDKFCDIIDKLDKEKYFIVLCGTRRDYVERRLTHSEMSFLNLGKLPYKEMNNLYNSIDYYLVTSRIEGGPQAILECMATKTKILSTPVGISNVLHRKTICQNAEDFVDALKAQYSDEIIESHYLKVITEFDSSRVVPIYENKFKRLLDL